MTNLKKLGLSALAGSLVATSAFAGEVTVAGGASVAVEHINGGGANAGKSFSMGNQLTFTGGGELDNGLNVFPQMKGGLIYFNNAFIESEIREVPIRDLDTRTEELDSENVQSRFLIIA